MLIVTRSKILQYQFTSNNKAKLESWAKPHM